MGEGTDLRYQRVLLKLSGEALAGDRGFGIDPAMVDEFGIGFAQDAHPADVADVALEIAARVDGETAGLLS